MVGHLRTGKLPSSENDCAIVADGLAKDRMGVPD